MEKHIIFGGNGPIGEAIYQSLKDQNKTVYKIGRKDKEEKDYLITDALNKAEVSNVSKQATHIYIAVGLPYFYKIWQRDFPIIIANIIDAAKQNKSKIIYFDNMYLYGPKLNQPMTETHQRYPISKKGMLRLGLVEALEKEMDELDILIVRSPDFFGPKAFNSMVYISFLENILKHKHPMFIGNPNMPHAYGYTKDLAKATVLLALRNESYGQTWHLPTYQFNSTHEINHLYNDILKTDYKIKPLSMVMNKVLKIFVPVLRETYEMRYQFETPYIFSSEKFDLVFPEFKKTDLNLAIKDTIEYFK